MQRGEEVKVGLFVLAAIALLLAAFGLVGGANIFGTPKNYYTLRTKFAGGIESGSPVRYAGMKVGRVEKLGFDPEDPGRAVVTISVDPQTPVRVDSTAKITSLGMLGENYVEISAGTKATAPSSVTRTLPCASFATSVICCMLRGPMGSTMRPPFSS
ncbi:MAG: MlaD family protein [Acidobacteria bacterium]|nr:MlaD family protein [Acidobacteriota bacterium]